MYRSQEPTALEPIHFPTMADGEDVQSIRQNFHEKPVIPDSKSIQFGTCALEGLGE